MVPSRELTYPPKMGIEDDFPFPKVGYVNSLEGRYFLGVFSGLLRLKLRGNSPLRYATSVLKSLRGGAVLQDFPQVTPGGCFSFGGTVQYIEESNIYLCFVVCRLKRGLVT